MGIRGGARCERGSRLVEANEQRKERRQLPRQLWYKGKLLRRRLMTRGLSKSHRSGHVALRKQEPSPRLEASPHFDGTGTNYEMMSRCTGTKISYVSRMHESNEKTLLRPAIFHISGMFRVTPPSICRPLPLRL